MARSRQELMGYLKAIVDNQGGDVRTGFKYAPYFADMNNGLDFSSDEEFDALMDTLLAFDDQADGTFTKEFTEQFTDVPPAQAVSAMAAAMRDNYVLAAFALKRGNFGSIAPNLALVATAAFNKHSYPSSLKDEFALVRMLRWCGFNIDAPDGDGMTALHYFASMRNAPYSNPRAVGWLLDHGANPNARNKTGDTPLIYMSASIKWTDALSESFVRMFNHDDSDPWAESDDGSTILKFFQELDPKAPHPFRQDLIAQFEKAEIDDGAGSAPAKGKRMAL